MELCLKMESDAELRVVTRALKVREYPAAFTALQDVRNGWRILAMCASALNGQTLKPDWPMDLTGASYRELSQAVDGENADFFAWCVQQSKNAMLLDAQALSRAAAEAGRVAAGPGPGHGTWNGGTM